MITSTEPHPEDCWGNLQTEKTYYPGTMFLHSYDGKPAYIEYWIESYEDENGRTSSRRIGVRVEKWFHQGKPANRGELPTTIFYDKQGNVVEQHWRNSDDQLDRADGPALIKWDRGERFEMWYQEGVHHREGKPAVVGDKGSEMWYSNGMISRTDGGPAITVYISIGGKRVCEQQWRVNNDAHRVDGAAIVRSNGEEEYWLGGKQVNEVQHMAIAAKLEGIENLYQEYEIAKDTNFEKDQTLLSRHRAVDF